jgi:serine/threonine protein kinase
VSDAFEEFGPYLVYERLGQGGMATVHRAEKRGVGFRRLIALKRLLPHIAADPALVKLFVDEARLASQLHHANVAQTYELGKVGDTFFIAMEYASGPTLAQIVRQCQMAAGEIPLAITVNILSQVCEALDYAHNLCDESGQSLRIIHRDVSPANIIVANTGIVKLIDFGIAKATISSVKTQTGFIKGKFGYIAPEYLTGRIDARVDLFAIGVVAHELMSGRRLFEGEDDFETLQNIRAMNLLPPSRWNARVPPDLDDIVMTALQRDPADRWQSAAAMQVALSRVARELGAVVGSRQLTEWVNWAFSQVPTDPEPIASADDTDAVGRDARRARSSLSVEIERISAASIEVTPRPELAPQPDDIRSVDLASRSIPRGRPPAPPAEPSGSLRPAVPLGRSIPPARPPAPATEPSRSPPPAIRLRRSTESIAPPTPLDRRPRPEDTLSVDIRQRSAESIELTPPPDRMPRPGDTLSVDIRQRSADSIELTPPPEDTRSIDIRQRSADSIELTPPPEDTRSVDIRQRSADSIELTPPPELMPPPAPYDSPWPSDSDETVPRERVALSTRELELLTPSPEIAPPPPPSGPVPTSQVARQPELHESMAMSSLPQRASRPALPFKAPPPPSPLPPPAPRASRVHDAVAARPSSHPSPLRASRMIDAAPAVPPSAERPRPASPSLASLRELAVLTPPELAPHGIDAVPAASAFEPADTSKSRPGREPRNRPKSTQKTRPQPRPARADPAASDEAGAAPRRHNLLWLILLMVALGASAMAAAYFWPEL